MQAKTPPGHIIQQRGEPGHFNPLQETQVNIQLLYRDQFQGEGTKNSMQKSENQMVCGKSFYYFSLSALETEMARGCSEKVSRIHV